MSAPGVFFYVQHLLGIGHLARASRVAAALAASGFRVTVATGGTPVAGFPGDTVVHVALPAVTARDEGFSGLVDAHGVPLDAASEAHRRDRLLAAFAQRRPDVLIIEAFPFGRRQMRFELLPLLEAATAASRKPLVATSIRDILQARTKPGRDAESAELVRRFFDLVLVHGDPGFARLEETFPPAATIADKVAYTGLVAPPPVAPATERFDVVVSAGGGAAGSGLVAAAVDAAHRLDPGLTWLLVTGPNLPEAAFLRAAAAAPANLRLVRFRRDFAALLAAARLSVSQAGYNTVCDILRAGCRAVLVPFAAGGETEQTERAQRLVALGLAGMVAEAGLDAGSLATAIGRALAGPAPPVHRLALDGAERTAAILRDALAGRTA